MKGIGRPKASAQTLSEYSLTFALIAVVVIAALMLLGKNINELLASAGSSIVGGTAAGSAADSGEKDTVVSTPKAPAIKPPAQAEATFALDAKTGQIQLTSLENAGAGKITTSSQGTELAALALERLLKNAIANDGTPADPESLALIKKLADLGHQMAAQQASLKLEPSNNTKSPAYKEFYYSGLSQTTSTFNATYDQLKQQIGSNPNYSNIMQQVNDYTGIASQITVQNYLKNYNPNTTTASIAASVRGTDLASQTLTTQFEPADIQAAMDNMGQLSKT